MIQIRTKNNIKYPLINKNKYTKKSNETFTKHTKHKKSLVSSNFEIQENKTGQINNIISNEQRQIGNKLIKKILSLNKSNNSTLVAIDVLNNYSTIQNTFAQSKDIIEKLINQRNDNNEKTWKWKVPLKYESSDINILNNTDSLSDLFITKTYKNKTAIIMVSPKEFLNIVDTNIMKSGKPDIEYFSKKKHIEHLINDMKNKQPIDTPYLTIDNNNNVLSHEGRHRASAAWQIGMDEIPVYVYVYDTMTSNKREELINNPDKINASVVLQSHHRH